MNVTGDNDRSMVQLKTRFNIATLTVLSDSTSFQSQRIPNGLEVMVNIINI